MFNRLDVKKEIVDIKLICNITPEKAKFKSEVLSYCYLIQINGEGDSVITEYINRKL